MRGLRTVGRMRSGMRIESKRPTMKWNDVVQKVFSYSTPTSPSEKELPERGYAKGEASLHGYHEYHGSGGKWNRPSSHSPSHGNHSGIDEDNGCDYYLSPASSSCCSETSRVAIPLATILESPCDSPPQSHSPRKRESSPRKILRSPRKTSNSSVVRCADTESPLQLSPRSNMGPRPSLNTTPYGSPRTPGPGQRRVDPLSIDPRSERFVRQFRELALARSTIPLSSPTNRTSGA